VIIGNLGNHEGKTVRCAIRAVGTRSRDPTLMPIVQALAKLSRRVKHEDPGNLSTSS
jgi:hypothetical protein